MLNFKKRSLVVVIVALLGISSEGSLHPLFTPSLEDCTLELGAWSQGAPIPGNHLEAATAVVNGKFFVISGFMNSNLHVSKRVDVYNPSTGIWETDTNPRRPTPIGFTHAQAAVDGQYIWIVGGFVGNHPGPPTNQVWKYDTVDDLWYPASPLPQKRAAGVLVRRGTRLHYIGGTAANRDINYPDHWVMDISSESGTWVKVADLPEPRLHISGAVIDGVIYAVGGQFRHDHDPVDVPYLHAYDWNTNTWERKADLLFPRSHFEPGTMIIKQQIVIAGGRANQNGYGNGQLKQVTAYDPQTDAWRELRELPVKLIAPAAARIGNKVIVTAGGTNWNTPQRNTYISQFSCQ